MKIQSNTPSINGLKWRNIKIESRYLVIYTPIYQKKLSLLKLSQECVNGLELPIVYVVVGREKLRHYEKVALSIDIAESPTKL